MNGTIQLDLGGARLDVPAKTIADALIARLQGQSQNFVPKVNDYWPGQGGIYAGIMRGDDGSLYHLIKGEADFADLEYGGYGTEQPAAACHWDGLANTRALLALDTPHPAAKAAAEYEADGHSDFYLMSRREGCLIAAAAPYMMQKARYWTSTQYASDHAWAVYFETGDVCIWTKGSEFRVCPVRRLPL